MRKKGPEGDDSREPGLEDGPTKSKHLTLFIGIPLRSKKGREVYPQVQGVINKLEAAGFPVHRYHSDRAKELRSDAVMRWIKERGIHPSSTAGESPAGNRAEIAVQQLKGMVRKLLGASRLDKQFWPLALMHASTRFWIRFNETLGIGQPNLLPFGMRIMARKRMRSGYETQWESRTQQGVYVGHAPSTPGGHLVLVPSEGGHKVLLTNTVYPLRAENRACSQTQIQVTLSHSDSPGEVSRFAVGTNLAMGQYPVLSRAPPPSVTNPCRAGFVSNPCRAALLGHLQYY